MSTKCVQPFAFSFQVVANDFLSCLVNNLRILIFEVHARRLAALKALTSSSTSSSEMLEKLSEIVFGILEKVCYTSLPTVNIVLL